MPWPATTIVYPGTCLTEGTNLSEGRGTTLPFHLVGAPWIDGRRLAEALNRLALPGVRFCPTTFQPASDKWTGQRCGGVQLYVTNRRAFRPVTAGLHLIATAQQLYPDEFAWRPRDRDEERDQEKRVPYYIDLLAGTDRIRHALDARTSVVDLVASWTDELDQFVQRSRPYRLYQ
jgi:uncharacterized protein YbbC (DUF1343 family)